MSKIIVAARNGHFKEIKKLIASGEYDTPSVISAIHAAKVNGHDFVAKYLLGAYKISPKLVGINDVDLIGNTLLHLAVQACERLGHADFDYDDKYKRTAHLVKDVSYDAIRLNEWLEWISVLIKQGADINKMNVKQYDETPLLMAARLCCGKVEYPTDEAIRSLIYPIVISALLNHHADVNAVTKYTYKSTLALSACNLEAVKLLLPLISKNDFKTDGCSQPWFVNPMFSVFDLHHQNYMSFHAYEDIIEILNLFKDAGADFNYRSVDRDDRGGQYLLFKVIDALFYSVGENDSCEQHHLNGLFKIVEYLLKNGVDVNVKDGNGDTVLHRLVTVNRLYYNVKKETYSQLLELFVKFGVNLNAQDADGNTPLQMAAKHNQRMVQALLALDTVAQNPACVKQPVSPYVALNLYAPAVDKDVKDQITVKLSIPVYE